jgi:hypothetical protein
VLLLAIVSLSVPLALRFSARVNAEVRSQARAQANLVEAAAAHLLTPLTAANRRELGVLANSASTSIIGRVTIVDHSGLVLADSSGPAPVGTNFATSGRPEFGAALAGRSYQAERRSTTLAQEHRASVLLVTALPIRNGSTILGAVRITQAVSAIHDAVRQTIIVLG